MTGWAGAVELRRRVRTHSGWTLAVVVTAAGVVGHYATWLASDYGSSIVGFAVFAAVAAYLLVQQPTPRAVLARGLYLLAGLVLVTPVFLNLPVLTGAPPGVANPAGAVFHPGVLAVALVFVVAAAVVGGIGYLVDDR